MACLAITSPIVLGLTVIYCTLLLLVLWGLLRVKEGKNRQLYTVSVVVAAKNEQQSIAE